MEKNIRELISIVKDVEGFLTDKEAFFLYEKASAIRPGESIVEIGSYCGKSTICLATGLKDSNNIKARVYAIDTFVGSSEHGEIDTYQQFQDNLRQAKVEEFVIPIKLSSEDAFKGWDKSKNLDFLWIDGGHEYEFVSNDINIWLRFIAIDGIIALHDTGGRFQYGNCMGIRRALKEHLFTRECLKDYGFVDSITYARKTHSMTPEEYRANRKAYFCWWIGEVSFYGQDKGFRKIKFLFKIIERYFRRIPKDIRKPWLLLKRK